VCHEALKKQEVTESVVTLAEMEDRVWDFVLKLLAQRAPDASPPFAVQLIPIESEGLHRG
jgi:hypothetical protein